MYDVIIVGAGIAGLYTAYKILKEDKDKNKRVLVLERETSIGGRADNVPFYGSMIATGAGIGRKKKDNLLLKLMREMGMPIREFEAGFTHSQELVGCNVKSIFNELKKRHYEEVRGKTFKQFAEPILGFHAYKLFVTCSGYSDYENEDAYDVLHYYGFEDNFSKFIGFSVSWHELIEKLSDFIGKENILKGCDIVKIGRKDDGYVLTDGSQRQYFTEKVVLATTVDSVKRLMKMDIYKHIHGQSFIRIYGKFSKDSIEPMREALGGEMVVPGPIYKIIPINVEDGVYMIVYSDNKGADYCKRYSENTVENREKLCRMLEKGIGMPMGALKLLAIKSFYWKIGTHYYSPLPSEFANRRQFIKAAQHPIDNVHVVGEMVSLHQGWVEGALESVESVIHFAK
jgi:hypothetical protein